MNAQVGLTIEKQQAGVFIVRRDGLRIGLVLGGNGAWIAERGRHTDPGHLNAGPFKTRRAAIYALDQHVTRMRVSKAYRKTQGRA